MGKGLVAQASSRLESAGLEDFADLVFEYRDDLEAEIVDFEGERHLVLLFRNWDVVPDPADVFQAGEEGIWLVPHPEFVDLDERAGGGYKSRAVDSAYRPNLGRGSFQALYVRFKGAPQWYIYLGVDDSTAGSFFASGKGTSINEDIKGEHPCLRVDV